MNDSQRRRNRPMFQTCDHQQHNWSLEVELCQWAQGTDAVGNKNIITGGEISSLGVKEISVNSL